MTGRRPWEIPPDRADGRSSWVHRALILSGILGEIAPWQLLPAWAALVAIACWPWPASLRGIVALLAAALLLVDWMLLALLPATRRSWGPVTPPLLGLTLLRLLIWWIGAAFSAFAAALLITLLIQATLTNLAVYALWVEPFRLDVTRMRYPVPGWRKPLRLLHISDIHFEGLSPREAKLVRAVAVLKPDVILLTGDYLNLSSVYDPQAQEGAKRLLAWMEAPRGTYAVVGSPVVDVPGIVPAIFADLPLRWLDDEAVPLEHEGDTLWLMGVRCTYDLERDAAALRRLRRQAPPGAYTILLYHTPDLMPVAVEEGVHLYLAGHTHGGQIRLPFYGAVATSSRWGKRYEMGLYHEGRTTLYVSRGLGVEGLGAPRARFLSPPEIILWELAAPKR